MKRNAIVATIPVIFLFSCAEPDKSHNADTQFANTEAFVDTTASWDNLALPFLMDKSGASNEKQSFTSYLIISSLNANWPSKSDGLKEINWQNNSDSNRYSRNYYQLDTLIEGRPVFADSLKNHFFFYLPFNFCWIMHSEFPSPDELDYLKRLVGTDFGETVRNEDYYRCGFEYGKSDSWKLENVIFSKNPWKHSENYGSNSNSSIEKTSMYQLMWVGKDPMPQLKKDWVKRHKSMLYDDWVLAYAEYKNSTDTSALFVPKPIGINYKNTLRGYFEDVYEIVDTVKKTYAVKLAKSEFEPIMGYYNFTTINENGDTMISPSFAHGLEMKVSFRSEDDTLVFPWPLETEVRYGGGISSHESNMAFELIMMEKMGENDHYFTFPKSSKKYISILLEFLLGETYISREFDAGNEVYWERIYTMPAKNEIERELGCFLSIKATGISLGCDEGGC